MDWNELLELSHQGMFGLKIKTTVYLFEITTKKELMFNHRLTLPPPNKGRGPRRRNAKRHAPACFECSFNVMVHRDAPLKIVWHLQNNLISFHMSPPRKMIDCVPGHEVWTQQDRGLSRDCHGLHSRQILGQIGSNKPPKVLRLEGFFLDVEISVGMLSKNIQIHGVLSKTKTNIWNKQTNNGPRGFDMKNMSKFEKPRWDSIRYSIFLGFGGAPGSSGSKTMALKWVIKALVV